MTLICPISSIGTEREREQDEREGRWKFEGADWDKYRTRTDEKLTGVKLDQTIDDINTEISSIIIEAGK